jgi:shikimate dehydrogenase
MNITPSTKLYAVLGHPIAHSLSPRMQNAAIRKLGLDALYLAFDVYPARLLSTLKIMGEMGFAGVNLTVPLKEVAFRGMHDIDPAARRLGSVNTVNFTPGGMKGFSTDGIGFISALKKVFGCTPKGLSICLLGCGGAGRAVGLACAGAGAEKIFLVDNEMPRAKRLMTGITSANRRTEVEIVAPGRSARNRAARASRLVIQATPVGMHRNDRPLLDADAFDGRAMLYDLVYMFPQTALMKVAGKKGCRTANGLDMLAFQGAASLSIWTGRKAPVEVMLRELKRAVYGKR